jgi:hypothetical protein
MINIKLAKAIKKMHDYKVEDVSPSNGGGVRESSRATDSFLKQPNDQMTNN